MRFMMIVKASKESEAGGRLRKDIFAAMGKFNEEMAKAGVLLAAEGLQASSKGARVQISRGKRKVIDGPFAETKELIAGFWLIQAKSLEEAVEWARRAPAPHGEDQDTDIEVRQVYELSDFPADLFAPEDASRQEQMRSEWQKKAAKS